jgi:hypothetical protein
MDDSHSSTLTSEVDLTEICDQSDLPFAHESRRTKNGFLVIGNRLQGFKPTPPNKRPPQSWVWKDGHGEALSREVTGEKFWLCRRCYDNKSQSKVILIKDHTTRIHRHMATHGFDSEGNQRETPERARQASQNNVANLLKRAWTEQNTAFDRDDFKDSFLQ